MNRRSFGRNRWVATGEALAEGGQAHLHVVTDSTKQRAGEYVIKLLKNTKRSPRLDSEIETTKRLHGAGCPVLEIVDDYLVSEPEADRPWYVAPRFTQGALDKRLENGCHYGGSFESAMQLYGTIVDGVLALHRRNVAHRDLKPANILLNDKAIVLADLGLALALGEIEGERLTAELERIGSLHYTPPEAFSRRPVDQHQFAFDAYALGKVLYEVLAGVPLPAFVLPTDPEFDLTKKWDGPAYRAVNRVLRGLLHNDPSVRMTYLSELPGQIEELISLRRTLESRSEIVPQWHNDLLSASDLLATRTSVPAAKKVEDSAKELADQISKEVLDVWQSSGVVEQLERALGTGRGGHLVVNRPTLGDVARSQLGGLQPTRRGLEPLEDAGYPFRPSTESGAHLSVSSSAPDAVPFRQLWLSFSIAVTNDGVAFAICVIRREEGLRAPTDVMEDRVRVNLYPRDHAALIRAVRKDAEDMLATYIQDVIEEVRRVVKT